MKFIILTAFLFLAACQDNSGLSAQQKNAAATDQVTYKIYSQIMDNALGAKLTEVGNNTGLRKGGKDPYRKGYPGFAHKALAACLAWNADTVVVRRKLSQTFASDDWGYAAVQALGRCDNAMRQKSLSCDCQLVDQNDVNVLQVPEDYWAAYEQKYGPGGKIPPHTATAGERLFYLEMTWESLLTKPEVYPVLIKEEDRTGYVKSASLIGGKKCDAVFKYHESGQGKWDVICADGTSATGTLQFRGQGKGSKGHGFDTDGNRIEFSITENFPETKT